MGGLNAEENRKRNWTNLPAFLLIHPFTDLLLKHFFFSAYYVLGVVWVTGDNRGKENRNCPSLMECPISWERQTGSVSLTFVSMIAVRVSCMADKYRRPWALKWGISAEHGSSEHVLKECRLPEIRNLRRSVADGGGMGRRDGRKSPGKDECEKRSWGSKNLGIFETQTGLKWECKWKKIVDLIKQVRTTDGLRSWSWKRHRDDVNFIVEDFGLCFRTMGRY